mgnify:CR=1 FL=1
MLHTPAPFPFAGSYALHVDTSLPEDRQRAELVRIMRYDDARVGRSAGVNEASSHSPCRNVAVSFPLRVGATGNRLIFAEELIDGTPLTKAEERELADLQRSLAGRVGVRPRPTAKQKRAEALRHRLIFSQLLTAELAKLRAQEGRERTGQGVPRAWCTGSRLPRQAA